MNPPILILDCNYLAHRAWHALPGLKYGNQLTGVIFGVLRDILTFQEEFKPSAMAFCFDLGVPLRVAQYPNYKLARRESRKLRVELNDQIKLLRKEILPSLDFPNVFFQKGYEADDVIASVCASLPRKQSGIIISADKDLYQCLNKRVSLYNPQSKKLITEESFIEKWGCPVSYWADAKAIAGCSTDEIVGVVGVKEITAIKFLTGRLNPRSPTFDRIVMGNPIWQKNLGLVKLPYPGTKEFVVTPHDNTGDWRKVCKQYGINTLHGMPGVRKAIKPRKGFGLT